MGLPVGRAQWALRLGSARKSVRDPGSQGPPRSCPSLRETPPSARRGRGDRRQPPALLPVWRHDGASQESAGSRRERAGVQAGPRASWLGMGLPATCGHWGCLGPAPPSWGARGSEWHAVAHPVLPGRAPMVPAPWPRGAGRACGHGAWRGPGASRCHVLCRHTVRVPKAPSGLRPQSSAPLGVDLGSSEPGTWHPDGGPGDTGVSAHRCATRVCRPCRGTSWGSETDGETRTPPRRGRARGGDGPPWAPGEAGHLP